MNGRRVVCQFVVDSNHKKVTPVAFDQRTRNLSIDSECHFRTTAIKIYGSVGDYQVIGARVVCRVVLGGVVVPDAQTIAPFASVSCRVAGGVTRDGTIGCRHIG